MQPSDLFLDVYTYLPQVYVPAVAVASRRIADVQAKPSWPRDWAGSFFCQGSMNNANDLTIHDAMLTKKDERAREKKSTYHGSRGGARVDIPKGVEVRQEDTAGIHVKVGVSPRDIAQAKAEGAALGLGVGVALGVRAQLAILCRFNACQHMYCYCIVAIVIIIPLSFNCMSAYVL